MNPLYTEEPVLEIGSRLNLPENGPGYLHPIRSFVRREGRITHAQRRALVDFWPRFGIAADAAFLDPVALFGRHAPLVLEIGFGNGESLVAMASANRDANYLGVDVHRPGIGHLLMNAAALDLNHLRVICADAVVTLQCQIADESLDCVQIFFPDPWPKTRHHKRRLVQPAFVTLVAQKLKSGGQLHMATDDGDYAHCILSLLNATPELTNQATDGGFIPRPNFRPVTRFERRGQRLGHTVRDLLFIRSERRV